MLDVYCELCATRCMRLLIDGQQRRENYFNTGPTNYSGLKRPHNKRRACGRENEKLLCNFRCGTPNNKNIKRSALLLNVQQIIMKNYKKFK